MRFLVGVIASPLERESAAAAAALWCQLDRTVGQPFPRGPWLRRIRDRLYELDIDPRPDQPDGEWPWPWSGIGGLESPDAAEPPLDWDPEAWSAIFSRIASRFVDPYSDPLLVLLFVRWRLARSAFVGPDHGLPRHGCVRAVRCRADAGQTGPPPARLQRPPGALVVSTMIHGTWGWKGDWWRRRSPFHEFVT